VIQKGFINQNQEQQLVDIGNINLSGKRIMIVYNPTSGTYKDQRGLIHDALFSNQIFYDLYETKSKLDAMH
jgi:hypothetical protein